MEGVLSATDKQSMVSSFLEVAVGQTAETARQFLQATSWKLEDAIQLFYVGNEGGVVGPPPVPSPPSTNEQINSSTDHISNESGKHAGPGTFGQYEDEVRPPLPVIREALYDDAMLYGAVCFPHLFNKCPGKIALNGGSWWPKISKKSPEESRFQTMGFVEWFWVNSINVILVRG
uniref:Uncharacterized protein n=1 Tax=Cucumis sativus TaxID=3659 RepID=A0A0A0KSQ2_CUCSA